MTALLRVLSVFTLLLSSLPLAFSGLPSVAACWGADGEVALEFLQGGACCPSEERKSEGARPEGLRREAVATCSDCICLPLAPARAFQLERAGKQQDPRLKPLAEQLDSQGFERGPDESPAAALRVSCPPDHAQAAPDSSLLAWRTVVRLI